MLRAVVHAGQAHRSLAYSDRLRPMVRSPSPGYTGIPTWTWLQRIAHTQGTLPENSPSPALPLSDHRTALATEYAGHALRHHHAGIDRASPGDIQAWGRKCQGSPQHIMRFRIQYDFWHRFLQHFQARRYR